MLPYHPISFWEGQLFYVEMMTEKGDLRTLFSPICKHFHVAITNGKGWADINVRAAMMKRYKKHERQGRQCVLLYCGDLDPDGFRISETLRNNLMELKDAAGWDPLELIIKRFGLNYDFIQAQDLTRIDNLQTSRKKDGKPQDLSDPDHQNHGHAYVQNYIKQYGARKVEANALVTAPEAGRQLCKEAILKYVSEESVQAYEEVLEDYRAQLIEAIRKKLATEEF